MAKSAKRKSRGSRSRPRLNQVLLLLLAVVLFAAALYGLLLVDAREPRTAEPSSDGAPPVDHIDDSSRDALREILREEGDE